MNLISEVLHNFIDGLVIGAIFTGANSQQPIITTSIAILLHEIPSEIGECALLYHA